MSLFEIAVSNLRCIEHAELRLSPGLTLIHGGNGSGKTSLLEGMFILGRGRSFRTRNTERLIRRGQNQMRVTGAVSSDAAGTVRVGFEVTRAGTTARIGGRPAETLAELSQVFAVQVVEPGIHRLVEEGGYRRRRWLDWAVFHVEPQFVDLWLRYTRVLKQRNAALKTQSAAVNAWDADLARTGEAITAARQRLLDRLQPYWRGAVMALSGLDLELHYLRGWSQEHSLTEALAASRAPDQLRRQTQTGPHRADVAVRLHGRAARDVLSRGQQKLVAVAMTISQIRLLQDLTQTTPTLLLDDPAAELDAERLQRFIDEVASLRCQLVVTSLQSESRLFGAPESTFYMDAGTVQPI
ncbi:MAG TPA: DNA replication/repair protein RecF [Steroidobacteraceae bacterium]|nr:DNA replication/repair protein RecF [Steroidobacteraceae bacterium]